jgi:hypothetical protein
VGNQHVLSDCGDTSVAKIGAFGRWPLDRPSAERKHKQALRFNSRAPLGRQPHSFDRTGQREDGRLRAAQKKIEALLFHRRMKAADHGNTCVPDRPRDVVSHQDDIAWTLDGAEERHIDSSKKAAVTDRMNLPGSEFSDAICQRSWILSVGR